jgi:hypothetical protein
METDRMKKKVVLRFEIPANTDKGTVKTSRMVQGTTTTMESRAHSGDRLYQLSGNEGEVLNVYSKVLEYDPDKITGGKKHFAFSSALY